MGLQAQVPRVPHLALWDRLDGYEPASLDALLVTRRAVRTQLMRTTIHLVTAADALALRPLFQPVLDRTVASTAWGQRLRGQDVTALLAEAAVLLAERPMGRAELTRALAQRHPDVDAEAVAFVVSYRVPWVQPPPRGTWTGTGAAVMAPTAAWLGEGTGPASVDDVVLRYLAAFGPATVRDVQAWCGLTRLGEVVDRLGPRLRRFRTPDGAELADVPGAPRPHPDTPAPARFLAEYDNATLGYADRSRVVADADHVLLEGGPGGWTGTVLVDGRVSATWAARRDGDATVLHVRPSLPLTGPQRDELAVEGARLLAFLAPDRRHDLRIG
ncbi:winged helix DNA-binding domain-containing protein [Blastococcus sp. SYSU D00669]